MKAAVLLSGCGLHDGSDIQESILLLLHLAKAGYSVTCFAPSMDQHEVLDHRSEEEIAQIRNVLVESSRIAPGKVLPLSELDASEFDCLAIPGGDGVSKNLTKWAFLGAVTGIHPSVRDAIRSFVANRRPVLGLSMAATAIAKAVQALECSPRLTVGIARMSGAGSLSDLVAGLESTGAHHVPSAADEPCIDEENRIVTVATSLAAADITLVERGIEAGVKVLVGLSDAASVSRFTAPSEESPVPKLASRPVGNR